MGFLTPVLLYNDTIHEFVKDPNINRRIQEAAWKADRERTGQPAHAFYRCYKKSLIEKILEKFGYVKRREEDSNKSWGGSGSCALVLPSRHADIDRILFVYGNTFIDLSEVIYSFKNLNEFETSCVEKVKRTLKFLDKDRLFKKKAK